MHHHHYNQSVSSSAQSRSHLRVDGVSFSYGAHRVLTDVSFVVSAGDRVGVIGENGSGKSTLLGIVAGALEPTVGSVSVHGPGAARPTIGLLQQEPPFRPTDTVAQSLESAVRPARDAELAVARLGDALARAPEDADAPQHITAVEAYADALAEAERCGAWEVDARIASTVAGVGLGALDHTRATGTLSGGQRARLALAWLLLRAPDVLLLDEPTNHLDDAATAYLVRVLGSWRGPVLMASHDRAFLDESATSMLDLDPWPIPREVADPLVQDGAGTGIGVQRFSGSYHDYLSARADARQRWERQYRDEQAELARLRASIADQHTVGHAEWRPRTEVRAAQKFYADRNARVVSRRVGEARARFEDLDARQLRKPPEELRFRGLTAAGSPHPHPSPDPSPHPNSDPQPTSDPSLRLSPANAGGPVIAVHDVAVAGRLAATSMSLDAGEKWLITGPNGSGKSTLLDVLAGTLTPDTGRVARIADTSVKLLAQDVEVVPPHAGEDAAVVGDVYRERVGVDLAERVPLGTFGLLAERDEHRRVDELSVGQRRRLALAVLLADPPEVLLLDEPTNHLSLSLVTELEAALDQYPGAVVIATHDRWLRRSWAHRHLELTPVAESPAV